MLRWHPIALLRSAKSCRPLISFIRPARRNEPAKDIRLRSLGETFPRLLFQTRYRVNCFAHLYFGYRTYCFALEPGG